MLVRNLPKIAKNIRNFSSCNYDKNIISPFHSALLTGSFLSLLLNYSIKQEISTSILILRDDIKKIQKMVEKNNQP